MDRSRFEHLLSAYGADFAHWPAGERGAALLFAKEHTADLGPMLDETRALDCALDAARDAEVDVRLLAARILAAAPRPAWGGGLDMRAFIALAACAAIGIALGYGGGLLAPIPAEEGAYFAMAFEPPPSLGDEG